MAYMRITDILLMYAGWLIYWLAKAGADVKCKGSAWKLADFMHLNIFEFVLSFLACLVLILCAPGAAMYGVNVNNPITIVITGYVSGSGIKNALPFLPALK
jgi:hypothetical protein